MVMFEADVAGIRTPHRIVSCSPLHCVVAVRNLIHHLHGDRVAYQERVKRLSCEQLVVRCSDELYEMVVSSDNFVA